MNGLLVGLTVGLSVLFIGVMIFGIIYWRKYRKTSTNLKYTATNNKSMHTLDRYFDMYQQVDYDDDDIHEGGELNVDRYVVDYLYVPVGDDDDDTHGIYPYGTY